MKQDRVLHASEVALAAGPTATLNGAASLDSLSNNSMLPVSVYRTSKRVFDVVMALLLLPVTLLVALLLLFANRKGNPGPLFYAQERMGQDCEPFQAFKFRSMLPVAEIERDAAAPLEVDRITPLGHFIRKSRLDELPQIFNVLRGEMSFIGPRPDYYPHAREFAATVPGYRERHAVKPGISGLAQTELGYAVGFEATKNKARFDRFYIRNRSLRMEAWIVWRTVCVILGRDGC